MDLQDTIEKYVMQLKNVQRTLKGVAKVCPQIMATLYDANFPGVEAFRPGPKSRCPDSDIICISWLLELVGKDSELAGYKMIKAECGDIFPNLPEGRVSIEGGGTYAAQVKNSGRFGTVFTGG